MGQFSAGVNNQNFFGSVVEYPGGKQTGYTLLPINLGLAGGIKPDNAGNLLIGDQQLRSVTEYTETGALTGNGFSTGPGDISQIALTRDGGLVAGANSGASGPQRGLAWSYPKGKLKQQYIAPGASAPFGIAFDPGQKGI